MIRNWTKRIERLESMLNVRTLPPLKCRYGYVRRLPENPPGNRHIAVSKSEPAALPNVELCEFEERLGPAPDVDELSFDVYLSREDEPTSPI